MAIRLREYSCGECGAGTFRIKAATLADSEDLADVALICCGCGSVTHLMPRTRICIEWGREREGERSDGVICRMDWPRDKDGRPTTETTPISEDGHHG